MRRKRFEWKLKQRTLLLGDRTLLMGILNVTPDSFSDGGQFSDPDRAFAHAFHLQEQGADILDIGAQSTAPGSKRLNAEEEWERLAPVMKRLRDKLDIPISVDTYHAVVAERALNNGAEIINDPSGLTLDPAIAKIVTQSDAGFIINHMRGTPETWAKLPAVPDIMGLIVRDLDATVNRALRGGVQRPRLVIDPGLGFGKRKEQNFEVMSQLHLLAKLELPILLGPSRKSFLARPTTLETSYANAAAVTTAILQGSHLVRVHEVKEMAIAAQVADAMLNAIPEPKEEPEPPARRPPVAPRPRVSQDQENRPRNTLRPPRRTP